ncbi:hypothetical protein SAMN06295960_4639 [Paenibacillus aquistagni]|uniref:DUF2577 domain-containing protein n=2 Tax=Paenibacillus aquistagni TaxID=1852522 RepID=A0A1X7LWW2_9BACL|nr:hypothetical protein SAMN06295960_4639 [Paenibacillus aquistagni]
METWEVQLAGLFKERNNPKRIGVTAAVIIDPLPNLKIGLGDEIILDMDQLIVANRIYQLSLKAGDEVVLVPATSEQQFYVIDKVGA